MVAVVVVGVVTVAAAGGGPGAGALLVVVGGGAAAAVLGFAWQRGTRVSYALFLDLKNRTTNRTTVSIQFYSAPNIL